MTSRVSQENALRRIGGENRHFGWFQARRRNLGRGGRAFWVGQAEFACRSRLEEAWEWVCCERLRCQNRHFSLRRPFWGPAGSDDSSAQGRGLSSATTVYLQVPPQAVLPRPEHRPNCRWSGEQLSGCCCIISLLAGMGGMGTPGHTGHRMLLSITLCFGPVIIHSKTISSPSFLPSS